MDSSMQRDRASWDNITVRQTDWTAFSEVGVPEFYSSQEQRGDKTTDATPWARLASLIPAECVPVCQISALSVLEHPEKVVWYSRPPSIKDGLSRTSSILSDLAGDELEIRMGWALMNKIATVDMLNLKSWGTVIGPVVLTMCTKNHRAALRWASYVAFSMAEIEPHQPLPVQALRIVQWAEHNDCILRVAWEWMWRRLLQINGSPYTPLCTQIRAHPGIQPTIANNKSK